MTTVWIRRGSTEPSAFWRYSMVTWVFPSGRNHQSSPLLRTSVRVFPRRVAIECVSGMQSSVSSVAYPNMMPWSPAPTSISSLPTCTPPAMSGDCLLMRTRTSHDLWLKPLLSTDARSSTKELNPISSTTPRGGAGDKAGDRGCFEGAAVLSAAAGPLEVLRYYNWAPNGAPTVQARLLSRQRGADTLVRLEYCTHPHHPEGACVATDVEFAVECRPAQPGVAVALDRAAPRARWDPAPEGPAVSWAFPRLEARRSGELRAVLRNARPGSLRARVGLRRAGGRPVVALRAAGEACAPGGALAPLPPASFLAREAIAVLP